jgi:RHS repeat-associated protein
LNFVLYAPSSPTEVMGNSFVNMCAPNELTVELDFDPVLYGITGDNLERNDFETEQFFYHPDHLGSSSFISDAAGQGYQHLQYMPFGETFISQKLNTWSTLYQFSAKEKDDETGFSYFGARYYSSDISGWLSVDPMAFEFPSYSAYNYCLGNPLQYIDKEGNRPIPLSNDYNNLKWSVCSGYGSRKLANRKASTFHRGVDLTAVGGANADYGAPVLSTHTGVVRTAKNNKKGGGGRYVEIVSPDGTFMTRYLHLSKVDVKEGDEIKEGQKLGELGGSAFGNELEWLPHLHYEIWLLNKRGRRESYVDPLLDSDEIASTNNVIGNLVDPQLWIDGICHLGTNDLIRTTILPRFLVTGQTETQYKSTRKTNFDTLITNLITNKKPL